MSNLLPLERCSTVNGFTVQANRYVGQQERDKLRDLISYGARGPFSHDRLMLKDPNNPDGEVIYKLKRPWSNGTEAILLTQDELIEKIVSLVPQPHMHLTRYFGVLSSHSQLKPKIILKPNVKKGFITKLGESGEEIQIRLSWAELLKRVFKIDITKCKIYGGHINATGCTSMTDPSSIKRILKHPGFSYHPPPIKPALYVQGMFDFNQRIVLYEG